MCVGSCKKAARVTIDWRMPLLLLMPKVSCWMPSLSAIQHTSDARLMRIEVIDQDVPFGCRRITGDQALKMSKVVFLIASGSPRGFNHLPGDHIKIEKPGKRPMPEILEFAPKGMACSHWYIGMQPLQRLHSCQLIQTDGTLSLLRPFLRREREVTSFMKLLLTLRIRYWC